MADYSVTTEMKVRFDKRDPYSVNINRGYSPSVITMQRGTNNSITLTFADDQDMREHFAAYVNAMMKVSWKDSYGSGWAYCGDTDALSFDQIMALLLPAPEDNPVGDAE
jgi:hypothetical protein